MLVLEKIMANPAGKDTGKEWVEVRNLGQRTNSSTIEIFALKPEPQAKPRLLHREKSSFFAAEESKKFLLKNIPNQNTILILKINGLESDRVQYESAPENLIFGKSTLQKINGVRKNNWIWHEAETTPSSRQELLVEGKANGENDFFSYLLSTAVKIDNDEYRPEYWQTVLNTQSRFLAETNAETQAVQQLKLLAQNPPPVSVATPLFFWPLPIALLIFLLLQMTTIESRQKSQSGSFTS